MPQLSEGEARFWDVATKVIGGVVAIVTLCFGFYTLYEQGKATRAQQQQFADTIKEQYAAIEQSRQEEIKKLEEEYRRRFWEKRLDLYSEASDVVSRVASLQLFPGKDFPQEEYSKALRRFYQLYYGPLCIVESEEVEKAMIDFKKALEANPRPTPEIAYVQSLLDASLDLAYACSNDGKRDWDVQIPGQLSPEELSKRSPVKYPSEEVKAAPQESPAKLVPQATP